MWKKILWFAQLILLLRLIGFGEVCAQTVSSFTASAYSGCKPLNIQFSNTSTNAVTYSWNFGNGNTSSQASPGNIYTAAGVYVVTLTATGPGGTSVATKTITVADPPVADFHASQLTACQNSGSISFINNSTLYDSCIWDFGDGSTSNQINPYHVYYLPGVFSVSLIVYNSQHNCNVALTKNQYITILPLPVVDITTNDSITCNQSNVFNFSPTGIGLTQWLWNFGDGTSSLLANPSHIFTDTGYFNIQLIASNSSGCTDTFVKNNFIHIYSNPIPSITPYATSGCAPLGNGFTTNVSNVSKCVWNYGDGFSDSTLIAYHNFNIAGIYLVQLNVTYNNGCTNQNSFASIRVDSNPSFSYTMNNYTGCAPLNVQFVNFNSTSGYSWLWDFGDGSNSTAASPTHIYTADGIYTVSLTATNQYGCTFGYPLNAKVTVNSPQSLFTVDKTTGCAPLTVNFNNQSKNGIQYFWNFGDGFTSNSANPSHAYLLVGTYNVSLITINSNGCSDTLIYNQPISVSLTGSSFTSLSPIVACAPFTMNFQDNSTSSAWLWNFGDGATASIANPSHTYTVPGNYIVSLSTQGMNGNCSQNIPNLRNIIINGGTAGFTHTETLCPPYEAFFTDTSPNAVAWLWNFDDGGTSTLKNPSHIFSIPGYHSVTLEITTAQGCKASVTRNYEVYFKALTAFITTWVADTVLPMSVQFNSHSVGATHWFWSFGDGDSSFLENPSHIYSVPGPYTLALTIWNDSCSRTYTYPPITFGTGSGTPGGNPVGVIPGTAIYHCAPYEVDYSNPFADAVSWLWNFGDGQTSTLENPSHLFTAGGNYQVHLTVQKASGLKDSVDLPDIVHIVKFAADFTIASTSSCTGTSVMLTPLDTTATCSWDMGNGTTFNTIYPTYVYTTTNSNYLISLISTDSNGCAASASQTFYASEINPLTATVSRTCAGDTVYFLNGGLNYNAYLWTFGDGANSTQANPFHVYQDSGIFQVELTVSDATGCSKSFILNQQIQVFHPQANFTIQNITSYCSYVKVDLVNQSTGADLLSWDFGNNQYSNLPQTSVAYFTPGAYYISLTVSKSICSSTFVSQVPVVMPNLIANFTYSQNSFCAPLTQNFTDLSTDAVSWKWLFGDGFSDTVQNPIHIYNQSPAAPLTLTVKDIYGCVKTISKPNLNMTSALFSLSSSSGCVPLTVFFNDSSTNALSWAWDFGDGISSNLQNPVHQYGFNGVYTVKLIVESTFGCFDTLEIDSMIHVGSIQANLSADKDSGCAPLLIQFADNSLNATGWYWDFGDGNFSNLRTPAHVFNTPGSYQVKLVASDSLGCSDTLMMPSPINIHGSIPLFTVVQPTGCTPMSFAVYNQSIGAVSWEWNFGNGVTDTIENPVYSFTVPGTYTVSLLTKDSSGCVSTYTSPVDIEVIQSAIANFSIQEIEGCTPFILDVISQSQFYDSLVWNFGNGNSSSLNNPQNIYNTAGVYNLSLIAYSNFGCNDTIIYPDPIKVHLQPYAGFTVSDTIGCMPFGIQFSSNSTNLDSPTYSWQFGNGDTSNLANPFLTYSSAGTYNVSLLVVNNGGCESEVNIPGLINIYNPLPPPPALLYSVSVSDTNQVSIKWHTINLNDIDYYILYRLNIINGLYDSIATMPHISTVNSVVQLVQDNGANTNLHTYTYKILAIDKCGSRVALPDLTAHTTVFLSGSNNGGWIDLNWSSYVGCNVSKYKIYRSDDNGITFNYLAETGNSTLNFTDTTSYCPFVYQYKVEAVGICGENAATGLSNIAFVDHTSYRWEQINDIIRATVVENRYILVEWAPTSFMPQTVIGYDIFRSTDNINFPFYKRVNSLQNYYEDRDASIQRHSYYYKVTAVNFCENKNPFGLQGASILLKGDFDSNGKSLLRWTPYMGWNNGVDHYELEKMTENGVWELIKTTDPNTTEAEDNPY